MAVAVASQANPLYSTTAATSYATGTFTPPASSVLIATVGITGNTDAWAMSDSAGGAWTKIAIDADSRALKATSADFMEVWVRNTTVAASPMTATFSKVGGASASGGSIHILSVTGGAGAGLTAIGGKGSQDNQGSGGTPAPVLGSTPVASSVVYTAVFVSSQTKPTIPAGGGGYTQQSDGNYNTPATGLRSASNTGITSATVTWGGTTAGVFSSMAIELVAPAVVTVERSAAIDAVGAVTTSGVFFTVFARAAAIDGVGAIASAATFYSIFARAAAIDGAGSISTSALFWTTLERAAALAATGAITTDSERDLLRAASLGASAAIATDSERDLLRSASLDGEGAIESDGEFFTIFERALAVAATAAIAGDGDFWSVFERSVSFSTATPGSRKKSLFIFDD